MISSMTGFGLASVKSGNYRYVVEIKSVNSRYLETRVSGSREQLGLEFELSKQIQLNFNRGKVDLALKKESLKGGLDESLLAAHFKNLQKIQKKIGLDSPLSLDLVFRTLPSVSPHLAEQENFLKAASSAIAKLKQARQKEGAVLIKDILARIQTVRTLLAEIEAALPLINEKRKSDVAARLTKIFQEIHAAEAIDRKKIEFEIALLIDRSDVTEEVVRLKSHITHFLDHITKASKKSTTVGRELDFSIQEMGREINTLGAKIGDPQLSQSVVKMKSEMEKIREQVQNIE